MHFGADWLEEDTIMAAPFIFKSDILKGKVALITGGATGLGYAMAERLAQCGADLVIASRKLDNCVQAATGLSKKFGIRALAKQLDVRHSAAVVKCFQDTADEMGQLDILVNNAAGNFYFPTAQLSDNQWNAVLGIDLYGTFFCSRAVFPHLKDRGGVIINISATLQYTGWVGMAPASAAKAGIDALTKTTALEWGRYGIRVNSIAPGGIPTEGVLKAFRSGKEEFEAAGDQIPIGRVGRPEDIADMAVFLSSPAATWVTGALIVVDGGAQLCRSRGPDPQALEQMAEQIRQQGPR